MSLEEYRNMGFDKYQLQEIQRGYNEGVNILKYADKKYSHAQMHQIRKGLLWQIDVSLYANPKLSYYKMLEAKNALVWLAKNNEKSLVWYAEDNKTVKETWFFKDVKVFEDDIAFLMQNQNSDRQCIALWDNNNFVKEKFIMNVQHGFDDYLQSIGKLEEKQRLFVDMDGTLAEFKPVDTLEKLYEKDYFLNLKPNENVLLAIKEIIKNNPDVEVNILSSVLSDSNFAPEEKNKWLDIFLPEISMEHRFFPPCGGDKKAYIPGDIRETDCLLDDYTQNLTLWQPPAKGIKLLNGINHTHESWAENCLRFDKDPSELSENIVSVMRGEKFIRNNKPQKRYEEELNKDYEQQHEIDEELER